MPARRKLRRVSFVWHRRASALRRCARSIFRPTFSNSGVREPRLRPHDSTNALKAVLTWHGVSSGFSPPPALTRLHTEQVRQRHQPLVPYQSRITAALEVIKPQLRFLILEATLHAPTCERHQQQLLHRRPCRRVADEVLHLVAVERV